MTCTVVEKQQHFVFEEDAGGGVSFKTWYCFGMCPPSGFSSWFNLILFFHGVYPLTIICDNTIINNIAIITVCC